MFREYMEYTEYTEYTENKEDNKFTEHKEYLKSMESGERRTEYFNTPTVWKKQKKIRNTNRKSQNKITYCQATMNKATTQNTLLFSPPNRWDLWANQYKLQLYFTFTHNPGKAVRGLTMRK